MQSLELNSAEKWRTNFASFTPQQLADFVAAGDLSLDFHATTNQQVIYKTYSGEVCLRVIYRAFGEIVSPESGEWLKFSVKPTTAYMVTGLILQQEPQVLEALVAMNGGTMPNIQPPAEE